MISLSDYEGWKAKQQQQSVAAANAVLVNAAEQNPDEVAGNLTLADEFAKTTGNPRPPTPLVAEYKNTFQALIEQKKNETILSASPQLTEWLRNPDNAVIARDDLQGLSTLETIFGATKNAISRGVQVFPQAANQFGANLEVQGVRDRQKSLLDLAKEELAPPGIGWSLIGDRKVYRNLAGPLGAIGDTLGRYALSRMGGTDEERLANAAELQKRAGLVAKAIDETAFSPAASAFKDKFAAIPKWGDPVRWFMDFAPVVANDPKGFVAFLGETAAQSLPGLAAATVGTAATKNPTVGATILGLNSAVIEAGTAPVDFFREHNVDVTTPEGAIRAIQDKKMWDDAVARGMTRGVVIGLMDGISGGVAGKTIAASPVANTILNTLLQGVMGAGGEALGQVASGQQIDFGQILLEGLAEFVTAPIEAAGPGGRAILNLRRQAADAEVRAGVIDQVDAATVASKLRERRPDTFRDFVATATEGTPTQNLFVPAQEFVTYFQGLGVDPYALADSLEGVSRDDLTAAIAAGDDLQIPTATYAAKISGTEYAAFFKENAKFSPGEMSLREAADFKSREPQILDETWQAAQETARRDMLDNAGFEDVRAEMSARFRAAGRSAEVANTEALTFAAFYRTMAQRVGQTVDDFMRAYPLPVVQGAIPQGMQFRDVDALNRTLAEARAAKPKGDQRQGLLDFIANYGGVIDLGGELKARDAETLHQPGKKKLRLSRDAAAPAEKGKSYGPDDVARAAIDAGFMADVPAVAEYKQAVIEGRETPDIVRAFWDAVDAELRGQAQPGPGAPVEEYLARLGLTLNDSDAVIKDAIRKDQAQQNGRTYEQAPPIESAAFKAWFGDSKVVDRAGKPLVVYHGSPDARGLKTPDAKFQSMFERAGQPDPNRVFFFASDRATANTYADDRRAWDYQNAEAAVLPVYLSIQNPMVRDVGGARYDGPQSQEAMIAEARAAGHDGIIIRNTVDTYSVTGKRTSDIFIAFEPTQIKSVDNVGTFNPADARIYQQRMDRGPRGSLAIPAGGLGNGDAVIRLFETADLSTVIHESGHYFLSVMQDIAAKGEKSAAADLASINTWWRENAAAVAKDGQKVTGTATTEADVLAVLDNGTTGDMAKDAAVDVGQQEQFARAFEAYLMEGKAPSAELRSAFEKFRAWLIAVYRSLANLNVKVSDDIRAVMDRMIATDDEIAKAKEDAGDGAPIFATAEQMGLTQEEFDGFLKMRAQAEDEAKARLLQETMEPIRRERERAYKEAKAEVLAEVEKEVNGLYVYRALEWMGNRRWLGDGQPEAMADFRLSKNILVERYGEGVLKTLPRGKQTIYAVEGGVDPDLAADLFGFGSGDEMIRALERATHRQEAIKAELDKAMAERYPDPLTDGDIEAKALDAVHVDKRGMWIAAELKAVTEVAGRDGAMTMKQARVAARQTIARMKVRDASNAGRFLAAERRAATEAANLAGMLGREGVWMNNARRRVATKARAALNEAGTVDAVAGQIEQANRSTGNYNETVAALIDAKRKQLLNHALYMEARKVGDEVQKGENFVARLNKATTRERIAGAGRRDNAQIDYLSAIDEILERYDFRKMSGAAEERRGSLLDFVEAMKEAGRENELNIPESVMRQATRAPYKTLPVEQFRGVIDSLKNLEHVASRWDALIDAQNKRNLDAVVTDIVAAFDANMSKRPPGRVPTKGENIRAGFRKFLDLTLTATTMLREVDGFKDLGPTYSNIKAPIDAAEARLIVRKNKAADDMKALFSVYTKTEQRMMGVREHVPALGYALSKWERLAVALNVGNEGNLQRLTDPRVNGSLTEAQVAAVLATLDARDAKFVQSVWDYVGTFKEDIAARERRVTGTEPAWVEAKPVEIAGQMLRGGYYPIKYDPRLSSLSRDDDFHELVKSLQAGRFGKAQTKNGHLEARAQSSGRAVSLDIMNLHRHVNQVIYDLEFSEPVANAWRVLQDERVRSAFTDAGRQPDFDALETWLQDVGTGQLHAGDWISKSARVAKSNFTAAKLAGNLVTAATQIAGVAQSMSVVGSRDFAVGMTQRFRPGVDAEIIAKSPYMSSRATTFNKDIYDFRTDPTLGSISSRWGDIKKEYIGPLSFWLMTKIQWQVDVPTWLAGYHQGLRQFGNDEAKAIAHADSVVKRAQASGLFSDRSAIERGSVTRSNRQNDVVRLFTTLASYQFAKFNIAYEKSAAAGRAIRDKGVSVEAAKDAIAYSVDMVLLFIVDALVIAAIKGKLPDDDDEKNNSWTKFLAKETGLALMGTVPFIRDVAGPLQGFDGGGAYGAVTKDLGAPFIQLMQGEFDKPLVKSLVNTVGLATGLPALQVNRAVDAAWRANEGEDVPILDYILGKRGKK